MTSLVQALKNQRLIILAERLTGLGILLPLRSAGPETVHQAAFQVDLEEDGVRKAEGEMSLCLFTAGLVRASQSCQRLMPIRPMVWELGSIAL